MTWSAITKDFINGSASAIEATGVGDIWERMARTFRECHPDDYDDSCNSLIDKQTAGIELTAAWIDYCLQWLPLISCLSRSSIPNKIYSIWVVGMDIVNLWNFYMYASLAIYADRWGSEIGNVKEMLPLSIITCGLSVFSSAKIRYLLRYSLCGWRENEPRGRVMQVVDVIFESAKGFANGRNFFAIFQLAVDSLAKINWSSSLFGMVCRYTFSGIWAAINYYTTLKFIPLLAPEDLYSRFVFKQTTIYFINAVMALVVLLSLMVFALTQIELAYKITYSILFSSLLPAILVRSWYKNSNKRCGVEEKSPESSIGNDFASYHTPQTSPPGSRASILSWEAVLHLSSSDELMISSGNGNGNNSGLSSPHSAPIQPIPRAPSFLALPPPREQSSAITFSRSLPLRL